MLIRLPHAAHVLLDILLSPSMPAVSNGMMHSNLNLVFSFVIHDIYPLILPNSSPTGTYSSAGGPW